VHAAAGQRVQIHRQRGHEGLAFAGGHFRDASGVQRVPADELHIEGDHLPLQFVASHGHLRVPQRRRHAFFHDGEGVGQNLFQTLGQLVEILDFRKPRLPLLRFLAQGIIRQALEGLLDFVDPSARSAGYGAPRARFSSRSVF
jgi:hypothetical protein